MVGQFKVTEHVCCDSKSYNPVTMKVYLKNAKSPALRPLTHLQDKFDFADKLTVYLYESSLFHDGAVYVSKVSLQQIPYAYYDLGYIDTSDLLSRYLRTVD